MNKTFTGKSHTIWILMMGHDKDKTACYIKGESSKLTLPLAYMTGLSEKMKKWQKHVYALVEGEKIRIRQRGIQMAKHCSETWVFVLWS